MVGYSRSLNESKNESGLRGLRLTSYFGQVFLHRSSPTDQSPRTQSRPGGRGSRSKKWEGDSLLPDALMVSREETSNCRCHQDSKLLPPPISMPRLAVLKPALSWGLLQAWTKGPRLDWCGRPGMTAGWIYPHGGAGKALGSQKHSLSGADFLFIGANFEAQS